MTVLFRAVVRNNGTANASAVQVMFFDNTAGVLVNLNRSSAFNLMPGSTFEASAMCTLIGPANSTHIFLARVTGAEANQTKLIGNALVPATVRIKSFTAAPSKMTDRPRDSAQTFRLTLVLENTGELAGTVFVTVIQGTKVIVPLDEKKVEPGTNLTITYDWRVKGEGKHTAAVSITGGVEPSSGSVNVQLGYKSTSGPDYMILIVLVVVMAAVAGAGAAFAMKKRGKPMKQGPAGESEGTQGKDGKT